MRSNNLFALMNLFIKIASFGASQIDHIVASTICYIFVVLCILIDKFIYQNFFFFIGKQIMFLLIENTLALKIKCYIYRPINNKETFLYILYN